MGSSRLLRAPHPSPFSLPSKDHPAPFRHSQSRRRRTLLPTTPTSRGHRTRCQTTRTSGQVAAISIPPNKTLPVDRVCRRLQGPLPMKRFGRSVRRAAGRKGPPPMARSGVASPTCMAGWTIEEGASGTRGRRRHTHASWTSRSEQSGRWQRGRQTAAGIREQRGGNGTRAILLPPGLLRRPEVLLSLARAMEMRIPGGGGSLLSSVPDRRKSRGARLLLRMRSCGSSGSGSWRRRELLQSKGKQRSVLERSARRLTLDDTVQSWQSETVRSGGDGTHTSRQGTISYKTSSSKSRPDTRNIRPTRPPWTSPSVRETSVGDVCIRQLKPLRGGRKALLVRLLLRCRRLGRGLMPLLTRPSVRDAMGFLPPPNVMEKSQCSSASSSMSRVP
mmetsp:Transcript_40346/g.95890  ORF Transcript_40346/g.95890 Transcript_40346/m.95890 type:complete len:389 (-) Transcript_40346:725-1891(-)